MFLKIYVDKTWVDIHDVPKNIEIRFSLLLVENSRQYKLQKYSK